MTTTSTYLSIQGNLAAYQKMTATDPTVKSASEYYSANIGKVTSISDFVGNYRLLSYALTAYGLGDQIQNTALITKVLEGGVSSSSSLANTLSNTKWRAFAAAFNFTANGAASVSTPSAVQTTTSDYIESQLESSQGKDNVGVELALYFKRVAPSVTSAYGIIADKNLLEVVQTIFGLPASGSTDVDAEANAISNIMPLSDLQDAKKLEQLTDRFTAMYDLTYGPMSGATTSLTASDGSSSSTVSAASTVLSGIISSNGSTLNDLTGFSGGLSSALLSSLQGLRLGG